MNPIKIGIIGDYDLRPSQMMTCKALDHAAAALNVTIEQHWIPTESLLEPECVESLQQFNGIWGSPGDVKAKEGTIRGIQFAREHNIPYIGTCAGFQHAILEFTRNVIGIPEATSAEFEPNAEHLVLTPLKCNIAGKKMVVHLKSNSLADCLYPSATAEEEYLCHFGINPKYLSAIEEAGLKMTGLDSDGEPRILELPSNRFFVASLFVPQNSSTPQRPHPLITGFVVACQKRYTNS